MFFLQRTRVNNELEKVTEKIDQNTKVSKENDFNVILIVNTRFACAL